MAVSRMPLGVKITKAGSPTPPPPTPLCGTPLESDLLLVISATKREGGVEKDEEAE